MEIIEKITNHNIFNIIDQYASIIVIVRNGRIWAKHIYIRYIPIFLDCINSKLVYKNYVRESDICKYKYMYKYYYMLLSTDKFGVSSIYNKKKKYIITINNDEMFGSVYEHGPPEVHPDVELYFNIYKPTNCSIKIITMKRMMSSKTEKAYRIPLKRLKLKCYNYNKNKHGNN